MQYAVIDSVMTSVIYVAKQFMAICDFTAKDLIAWTADSGLKSNMTFNVTAVDKIKLSLRLLLKKYVSNHFWRRLVRTDFLNLQMFPEISS